jgi:3-hydroxybutyryl-CoA dehydrogenase
MNIGIVGAGTMGSGIAQVCAFRGHEVILKDTEEDYLERAVAGIRKSLCRILEKQGVADPGVECDRVLERIHTTTEWHEFQSADFVVEAVFEKFGVKREVFEMLERACRDDVVLASNTSSISVTRLAGALNRPERVIGMHFMNPVPLMKLVEIVRGLATSQETFEKTRDLAVELEKSPVEVRDSPGFVSNRVLMPMINEAVFALMEGVAEPEAIDQVMKLGMNHPMGPLRLADLIGLDICLDILQILHEGFGDPKYRPCPLLRKMVDAGWLGRKAGRGFYDYGDR